MAVLAALIAVGTTNELRGSDVDLPEMVIQRTELGLLESGYHPLLLETNRGDVECRYHPSPGASSPAAFVM